MHEVRGTFITRLCSTGLLLLGCGGSKSSVKQLDAAIEGGLAGSSGGGSLDAGVSTSSADAGPPITPLADHSAGKACKGDADCGGGGGTCASSLMSSGG